MDYYFEGVTPYDTQTLRDYAKFHYRHINLWLPLVFLAGGCFCLLSSLFTLVERPWESATFRLAAGVVLPAFAILLLTGRVAARVKNAPGGQVAVNRYRFCEDRVEYASQQTQGFYFYHQFTRVYENRYYFFFYVAKNQALVLRKDGMTRGDPDQLRQFVWQKVGPRFSVVS